MIDNPSLLIGIAFSSASLAVALAVGWVISRREPYLAHGAVGLTLVMAAVLMMGLRENYTLAVQLPPFILLLAGFSLLHSGSRLFINAKADLRPTFAIGSVAILTMSVPFIIGWSGLGTLLLNAWAAIFMLLCAWEYWRGDDELREGMMANTVLYTMTALSFAACAVLLALDGRMILDSAPDNWAEDVNSIVCLVGITGIGATTMMLHYSRAARRHRDEANTDSLTGVYNRRAVFGQYAETDLVPGLAVLMFDLDHFKQINDRLGHAQGDNVLKRFADVLREQLRPTDMIARLGGEEFCSLLPDTGVDVARELAERVRATFADQQIAIGEDEFATVSIGLAIAGADETFSSVLRRADTALYKAKRGGRNRVQVAKVRLVA